ncbi:hypothetical protein Fot_11161 [Forsythia ovata]|uniref:Uncharacterized protein n=1 Tax=Forsythia ovata TaxID=205694 RepID=A0ABD1WIW2_9LAMI
MKISKIDQPPMLSNSSISHVFGACFLCSNQLIEKERNESLDTCVLRLLFEHLCGCCTPGHDQWDYHFCRTFGIENLLGYPNAFIASKNEAYSSLSSNSSG